MEWENRGGNREMGEPFQRFQLTNLVRNCLAKSKIGKTGGCHLFRFWLKGTNEP
jgi:hypothetical protein